LSWLKDNLLSMDGNGPKYFNIFDMKNVDRICQPSFAESLSLILAAYTLEKVKSNPNDWLKKKDYKNNDAHILTIKLLNDPFIVKLACFVHVP